LDPGALSGEDEAVLKTNRYEREPRWAHPAPLRLLPLLLAASFGASCNCGGPAKPVEEAGVPEGGADAGDAGAPPEPDLIAAGRALEAGDVDEAVRRMPPEPKLPEELLVAARLAAALERDDEAVRHYEALAGAVTELEPKRLLGLARALAGAGRFAEAVDTARALLDIEHGLDDRELSDLAEQRGEWLIRAGRADEAVQVLSAARKNASRDHTKDRLGIALARAYDAAGKPDQARDTLRPIALEGASGRAMGQAFELFEELGAEFKLTPKQRVERAEKLIGYRSWDAAAAMLKPLTESEGKSKLHVEARWLEARLLFKRRRHYEEAITRLDAIIAAKGANASEARFLRARALSRLDRDDEAIVAYREFAKLSKRPGRASEARFLAGRLEFFLGQHEGSLESLEALVGKDKKKTKSHLTPGRVRDAHFLAGMCALLEGKPKRAEPHFEAASVGSSSQEAIERNTYWYAVARLDAGHDDGPDLLRKICGEDQTSWYAALARRRLEDAGKDALACEVPGIAQEAEVESNDAGPVVLSGDDGPPSAASAKSSGGATEGGTKTLEDLSPLAALLARGGLFAEAAAALREAEQSKTVEAETRDWIEAYNQLDSPHHAVRRASRGLSWPPASEDLWRARAAYPIPYPDLVAEVEDQRGLPNHLIPAIARKESLFDPRAVSRVGAMGMMQMMPHTYETNRKRAGLPPLADGALPGPVPSIRAAGHELEHLLTRFEGSLPLAIMAYNGGSGAVSRWLDRSGGLPIDVFVEKGGFAQTRNYVRRVFRNLVRYRQLYGLPLPELPLTADVPAGDRPPSPASGGTTEGGTTSSDASI